jgi:hypothetical protein
VSLREKTKDALAGSPPGGRGHRGGEMGERIRQFDWSTTPLGRMKHWPQSLRTVINILLSSRYAMWMAWGPELTMLYNDAYQPTLDRLSSSSPLSLGRFTSNRIRSGPAGALK